MGVVFCECGFLSEGETIFKQIVESSSLCSNAILNTAHVAMAQQNYSEAIEIYKKCLKDFLPDNSIPVMELLAHAYFQTDQFNEARLLLCQARRVEPHNRNILFNLALVMKEAVRKTFDTIKTDLIELQKAEQDVKVALRLVLQSILFILIIVNVFTI